MHESVNPNRIYFLSSIEEYEPKWWKMAFGMLKDDRNKTRVSRSVLVRITEVVHCLKHGDEKGAMARIGNVSATTAIC